MKLTVHAQLPFVTLLLMFRFANTKHSTRLALNNGIIHAQTQPTTRVYRTKMRGISKSQVAIHRFSFFPNNYNIILQNRPYQWQNWSETKDQPASRPWTKTSRFSDPIGRAVGSSGK